MYASWYPMIKAMTDAQAGELLKACYALECGEEYEISDATVKIVFETVKATMLADRDKYAQVSEKRRQAALASKSTQVQANASKSTDLLYESESDSDNDKDFKEKEYKEREKRFKKPTVEQVRAYCQEKGYGVDPEAFVAYYDSNGWKVGGRGAMKSWQSALVTWEKRNRQQARGKVDKWKPQSERSYDFDDLEKKLLRGMYG